MKLYAPLYYKKFKCIADRCTHSCCIGWEIDVDSCSYEKYRSLSGGYGEVIKGSIDNTDTPCFKLSENNRCPHLSEGGLCNIITNLGQDYLCEICREHPRFYNDTPYGKEVGLGLACEEACRVVLGSNEYKEFYIAEELKEEPCGFGFDPIPYRTRIFDILALDLTYGERLDLISKEFGVSTLLLSDGEWHSCISSLEYLEPQHRELFLSFSNDTKHKSTDKTLERAFAYFIYRHLTQAADEVEACASVGFAFFCERLLRALSLQMDTHLAARIISEELEYSQENTEAIKQCFYEKIL